MLEFLFTILLSRVKKNRAQNPFDGIYEKETAETSICYLQKRTAKQKLEKMAFVKKKTKNLFHIIVQRGIK